MENQQGQEKEAELLVVFHLLSTLTSLHSEILEAASELGCANWHMGRTERKEVPPEDSAIAPVTSHLRGKRARLYM